MRYGSATFQKRIDGRKLVIRVRVSIGCPATRRGHTITYRPGVTRGVAIGAYCGVCFAQRRAGRWAYDIRILEVSGDVDCPEASQGAAAAAAVAAWIACGDDWHESELGDTCGWSICRSTGR